MRLAAACYEQNRNHAGEPFAGNPAIQRPCALRTGGFASPSLDGFALYNLVLFTHSNDREEPAVRRHIAASERDDFNEGSLRRIDEREVLGS
jgi:hypothetical protein